LRLAWAKKLARYYLKEQAEHGGTHCNPSYKGGIKRRILVPGQFKQKAFEK
jgi:hypothetical protein